MSSDASPLPAERRESQSRILETVRNAEIDISAIKVELERMQRELGQVKQGVDENRDRLDGLEEKQQQIKDGQTEIIAKVGSIGEDTGALRDFAKVWQDSQAVIRVTKASGKAVLSISAVAAAAVAAWHFVTDFLDR